MIGPKNQLESLHPVPLRPDAPDVEFSANDDNVF
jgi:hypothetical protein